MSSNSKMCILPEAFLHWKRNPSHVNEKNIKSVCICVYELKGQTLRGDISGYKVNQRER